MLTVQRNLTITGWGFSRAQETGKRFAVDPGFHRQGVTSGKGKTQRQERDCLRDSEASMNCRSQLRKRERRIQGVQQWQGCSSREPGIPGMHRPCLRALTHCTS